MRKWLYVEDKRGNLLLKEFVDLKKAKELLFTVFSLIITKQEGSNYVIWTVYAK